MGVVFFAGFMLFLLGFSGILFIVSFIVTNHRAKQVLRLIVMFIIGLPVSWIVFILFINISPDAYGNYLIAINSFGILGNIIYKAYVHFSKKDVNKRIRRFLKTCLYLSILSDPFPIMLLWASSLSQ